MEPNIAWNTFDRHSPLGPEEVNKLIEEAGVENPKILHDDDSGSEVVAVGPISLPWEIDGENTASIFLDLMVCVPGVNVALDFEWNWDGSALRGRLMVPEHISAIYSELHLAMPDCQTYRSMENLAGIWLPLSKIREIVETAHEENPGRNFITFNPDHTRLK